MIERARRCPVLLGLLMMLAFAPLHGAAAETCTADDFGAAVDASAAELRAFSADTQPKLKHKLQALRDARRWTEPDFETKGLALVHDAKLDEFDSKAGELLSTIDALGTPDTASATAETSCANLSELKAASSELMAVMRAKSDYLIAKLDREIAGASAHAAGPAVTPPPGASAVANAEPSSEPDVSALSPVRKQEPATPLEPPPPAAIAPPAGPPTQEPPHTGEAREDTKPPKVADVPSSWSTTTAQAVVPPPVRPLPPREDLPPAFDPPASPGDPPGAPYALPPPGGADDEQAFAAGGEGYSIEEIRAATQGFFGTISTSLASVIEHAFQKAGRPTAYVLGTEGGGAFLAGLRYGQGTLYLRSGGTQKVYWHGPSIGYDMGAEGSRTLFLIYDLHEPSTLFRRFTGVDGSAYLVGGVGMTLLKGGEVVMAPIRSGLGLRLGASIGYVRFTPRPTWNPF